jgi:RNA polymerase sigma-70 factor (ECF subfamily)
MTTLPTSGDELNPPINRIGRSGLEIERSSSAELDGSDKEFGLGKSRPRRDAAESREDFGAFYAAEFDNVFRASSAFLGDSQEAWDATQEAFSRAFARWKRLRREDWAGGWVMTTALNLSRRELHRSHHQTPPPAQDRSFDGERAWGERLDLVEALLALPPRQRKATVLYYLGDFSVTQVARLMEISEGTVKAQLSSARTKLLRTLATGERTEGGSRCGG